MEVRKSPALNVIVRNAIPEGMGVINLASIVLDFAVRLRRALRRQQVGPNEERPGTHFKSGAAKWQSGVALCRIDNLVLEFQVREANAMAETARSEIKTNDVLTGDVFVIVERKP